jgi:excisionase family DNA binding protein
MQEIERLGFRRKEAGRAYGISTRKIDYLIAAGKLKAVKIGGTVIIPRRELEKLAEVK